MFNQNKESHQLQGAPPPSPKKELHPEGNFSQRSHQIMTGLVKKSARRTEAQRVLMGEARASRRRCAPQGREAHFS